MNKLVAYRPDGGDTDTPRDAVQGIEAGLPEGALLGASKSGPAVIGSGPLATINERLKREGIRTIDLDNAEHMERYGLEALAKDAGRFLQ
jgi:hypothetical protein